MDTMIYSISDISASILSGGDASKFDCVDSPTEEYNVPVFANAVANKGLYGYTNKPVVNKEAITIAARGAGVGFIAYRRANFVPIVRLITIIPNETYALAKFLYYYLSTQNIIGGGAAIPQLTVPMVKKIKVQLPPVDYQRRIASILSAYDNLIENNNKRIRLLEQMAENLYKEWFVRFRFPGHEKAEFENGLPKGWIIEKIGNVCETIGGGTPSTEKPEYWDGEIKWVTPTDVTSKNSLPLLKVEGRITEEGLKKSSAKLLPPYTILMTSRASIGFFGIAPFEVCTNQGFISIIPQRDNLRMYMLYMLKSRKDEITANANGATFLEISKGRFRKMKMLLPPDSILESFENKTMKIFNAILKLEKQNDLLSRQRDLLLPRLMPGKLEVNV